MPSASSRWRGSELAVGLSKFRPLETILAYDDFDQGLNGWTELTGNYRQDTMAVVPGHEPFTDLRPPMLSSATFPIVGTHGSMSGIYSMKLATRAVAGRAEEGIRKGGFAQTLKRLTWQERGRVQFEMWFTYKPEAERPGIGEDEFRAFGVLWDLQDDEHRYFPAVRYLNAANGVVKQKWQFAQARGQGQRRGLVGQRGDVDHRGPAVVVGRQARHRPPVVRPAIPRREHRGLPGHPGRRAAALLQRDVRQDQLALPPLPGGLEPARVRGAPVQRADVRPAGHPAHARAGLPADLEPAQPRPLGGGGHEPPLLPVRGLGRHLDGPESGRRAAAQEGRRR